MNELVRLLEDNEDWLMARILEYAMRQGYTKYSSTLPEAWRLSITGLTDAVRAGVELHGDQAVEFEPDEHYAEHPIAAFGVVEAKRHRRRGISLGMFLGLLKYYRQSYQDLIRTNVTDEAQRDRWEYFLVRCFDLIEIALCVEWRAAPEDAIISELQHANRQLSNEKNRYLTLFESLCDPAYLLDEDLRLLHFNPAGAELFNVKIEAGEAYYSSSHVSDGCEILAAMKDETAGQFEGRPLAALLPWLQEPLDERQRWACETHRREVQTDFYGSERWFAVSITDMIDFSGVFSGAVVVVTDITLQKSIQALHEINEERLSLALDATSDGIWDVNLKTQKAFFSSRYYTMLGYDPDEFEASGASWKSMVHPDDLPGAIEGIDRQIVEGQRFTAEFRMRSKSGQWLWILARGKVTQLDDTGAPVRMVGTHQDITERKRMEEEIRTLASTDSLTGVNNRRSFMRLAEGELARSRRHGRPLAMLMLDLDHFKRINDTYGHHVGDITLQVCTRTCIQTLRENDIFGRIGGEEFGAVLGETSTKRALQVAERLRKVLEKTPVEAEEQTLYFQVSIGVAVLQETDGDVEALLQRADEAMYQAKEEGRNRVVLSEGAAAGEKRSDA